MSKYIRIALLLIGINSIYICLFGQFYHFKQDTDTCYCNDIFIIGVKHFDTLTSVVPPESYKFHYNAKDYMKEHRIYTYAIEKKNAHKLINMHKDQYLYSLFDSDVYIVAPWPYVFYNYFVKFCADDSLKDVINNQMTRYLSPYKYCGEKYPIRNFFCMDYQQQQFLAVLMNVNLYNKIVVGFNFCPPAYILSEFDENISKGLYVKILLPLFHDDSQ